MTKPGNVDLHDTVTSTRNRSSPANPAMKLVRSSRSRSESAASWRAAAHPSVRVSSVARSAAVRSKSLRSLR